MVRAASPPPGRSLRTPLQGGTTAQKEAAGRKGGKATAKAKKC